MTCSTIVGGSHRFAVATDFDAWHERRLRQAFQHRGVEVGFLSLKDCRLATVGADETGGLQLPGFEQDLPRALFVRNVPGGSFEQVTLRLDILHALPLCGVPVCNDARTIERTVDKAMTSFLLRSCGVPTPPTWACESRQRAVEVAEQQIAAGHRLVLKPLFGSRGNGLILVGESAEIAAVEQTAGVYYLQQFVPPAGPQSSDWRVFVIGERAVATMERRSGHWITNRAQGGECRSASADSGLSDLAVAATRAVGARYAGVDIIRDREHRLLVLEVNGVPAWRGVQEVTGVDIAGLLVEDLFRLADDSARVAPA